MYIYFKSFIFCSVFFVFNTINAFSQNNFSQITKNQLLGENRLERHCYKSISYSLSLKFDTKYKNIYGNNEISIFILKKTERIQFDLSELLNIDSVIFNGKHCDYQRFHDSFIIDPPQELNPNENHKISIYYHGKPVIAQNAPWDGGFVFDNDQNGNPFIGIACEGIGAHSWWPCKDLLSEKCDSLAIRIEVPKNLQAISNGKLVNIIDNDSTKIYHWKVTYPIANYNVSMTIGNFTHFQEIYKYKHTSFPIDYYVLPENIEKAKRQFKQVKPMVKIYEKLFGPYPFVNDGFKIVEAPYLGMEHQSAIAYGNGYQNGYNGKYFSPINQKFDFIIIHEAGHEYWGNNVGMSDKSDMWINEGFCTYTELLYVEKRFGKKYTTDYMNYWKQVVQNQEPIVNERYSNIEPTSDIYYKGALLVHTLRYLLNDDKLFFSFIKEIQAKYAYQTMDTKTMIHEFNSFTKHSFEDVFDVFLNQASPAILNFTLTPNKNNTNYIFRYKWDAVEKLNMPIEFRYGNKKYKVNVTQNWNELELPLKGIDKFEIDESKAYFIIKYE